MEFVGPLTFFISNRNNNVHNVNPLNKYKITFENK